MEPVSIGILLAALGWTLLRKFYPSAARKAEAAVKKFRPAFDAVEALKAAGVLPKQAAAASSYFVQYLEAAGYASSEIDEGLKWAEQWAKNQPRSERIAYKAIGDRAKMATPRAYVDEIRRQLDALAKKGERVIESLERLKRIQLLPPPSMTEIPAVPTLDVGGGLK